MRVSISFDPHRGKPYISNLRTGNCFDALVKADVDLRVCATSVQVAGSHATLQSVCLQWSPANRCSHRSCEPRSSHRIFPCCYLVSRPPPARSALPRERFRSLCRFSDAGVRADPRAEAAGVRKAPRHEVAVCGALADSERYGDLTAAPRSIVGGTPSRYPLHVCRPEGWGECLGDFNRGWERIHGRTAPCRL
jgi:hypothetical protein